MNDQLAHVKPPQTGGTPLSLGRIWRITRKELRETLRDRRTIITLLLMPLLVYPILSLAFMQFLRTSYAKPADSTWSVGLVNIEDSFLLSPILKEGDAILQARNPDEPARSPLQDVIPYDQPPGPRPFALRDLNWVDPPEHGDLEQMVRDEQVDMGIRIVRGPNGKLSVPLQIEMIFRPDSTRSKEALHVVEQRLRAINEFSLAERLKAAKVDSTPAIIFAERETKPESPYKFPMATLLPLILILMTITGAVYPAIDLTAGERERGTLESLIASPMSRFAILIGKYIAVLTVAVLTAVMNITAMTITLYSTGLSSVLFGQKGLSPLAVLAVFGLMVLFAAFFSAVLLSVTSFARSFKEAQAYLIPLMLVSMTPGFLATVDEVRLEGWWAVTPLANIVLLARDVLERGPDPTWTIVALASTFIYGLTALVIAAQIFGNDAILYGSQDSWEDWMLRPKHSLKAPTMEIAFLTLAIIFPLFVWLSGVGLWQKLSLQERLGGNAVVTAFLFVGIPVSMMWWRRVSLLDGLQLTGFHLLTLLGAIILGCSMFPAAFELVQMSERLGLSTNLPEQKQQVAEIAKELQKLPLPMLLLCFAVVPALCEELFFRGFFFTSLRSRQVKGVTAVLLTATLFGLFHVLTGSGLRVERLFSTTAIGCVLAWVALRSGSVVPGIVTHMVHNAIQVILIYYHNRFAWLNQNEVLESQSLPRLWHVLAGVGLFIGGFLVWWSTRGQGDVQSSEGETAPKEAGN